jgi:hypothetical protein
MTEKNNTKEIESLIVEIRHKKVLIDKDVAKLYETETKKINQVVKNNLDKFPEDYLFELSENEFDNLRSLQMTSKFDRYLPKAFTEKGLYMLATLLRSKKANEVTFQIIETFAKIKELSRNISQLSMYKKENPDAIMQRNGDLFNEIFEESFNQNDTETTFEINFAVLKFKHTLKSRK